MDEQIAQQVGIGSLAVIVGLSGWLLPFRYNLLRLRRRFARLVSEETNRKIPKILGTMLLLLGVAMLVATALVGSFQ